MPTGKDLFGGTYIKEDNAICLSVKRYEELIRKEFLLEEILKNKVVSVKLLNNTINAVNESEEK